MSDVGRPSTRARSQHDSVGDSEIGAVPDGTGSGAAGGGASYYSTWGLRRGYDPPTGWSRWLRWRFVCGARDEGL